MQRKTLSRKTCKQRKDILLFADLEHLEDVRIQASQFHSPKHLQLALETSLIGCVVLI